MDINASQPPVEKGPTPALDIRSHPLRLALLGNGCEPDPRFTLANERTFLAWIRTAVALQATGIAIEAFSGDVLLGDVRKVLALILLTLGMLIGACSWVRWLGVERAMRQRKPLPLPLMIPVLVTSVALFGLGLILALYVRG